MLSAAPDVQETEWLSVSSRFRFARMVKIFDRLEKARLASLDLGVGRIFSSVQGISCCPMQSLRTTTRLGEGYVRPCSQQRS